ncbi:RNase H domain-containing protein [Trichonephila clavipes]|nr:RNase H domain-containing protein [Trichonephila clavipes]
MVSFNFTVCAVEPHQLSLCLDPADDVDGVFFHPELPVYTGGSRDDCYRFGSRIYIKAQDHFLRIQGRNSDVCSIFRCELIAIDVRPLVFLHLFQLEKMFGYCLILEVQYSLSSNWQSVRDNVGVSILTKLKRLSTSHQNHLHWIPSNVDLEGNEIVDTFACEVPEPSAPLTFLEIFSRTKHQNKTAWIIPPRAPLVSVFSSWRLSGSRFYLTGSNSSSPLSKWPS